MDYSRYQHIEVKTAEGIATVTLNRPDVKNAVNAELHRELENIWVDLAQDSDVLVVVLTGAGDAFSAGGDIKKMAQRAGTVEGLKHALSVPAIGRRLFLNMLEVPQPIIAAINGDAIGLGATVALFSDTTIIADTARIGDPHVRIGLVAGDGGAVIWPLLVGPVRAKELLMRGKLLTAAEASGMNLVNYAVPAAEVLDRAMEIAKELTKLPVWAVRWTKLSINKGLKQQFNLVMDASLAFEAMSMVTEDFKEATTAFVEKRKPKFQGY